LIVFSRIVLSVLNEATLVRMDISDSIRVTYMQQHTLLPELCHDGDDNKSHVLQSGTPFVSKWTLKCFGDDLCGKKKKR